MPSKVLLAGSDRMLQQMAGTFDAGQIHTASTSDGYEAVCLLNETTPDLLIAEIGLPQKDGYALCRYVRQEPEFQSLPVILLDGEFNAFNQRRAFAAGADVYLSQPLSPDELIETMQSLLTSNASPDDDGSDEVGENAALLSAQTMQRPPLAKKADHPHASMSQDEAALAPPVSPRFDAEDALPPPATRRPSHLLVGAVALAAMLIAISLAILTRQASPGEQAAATDQSSGALATTGPPYLTAPEPETQATARAASLSEATSSPDTSSATSPVNQEASAAAYTVDQTNAPGDAQASADHRDASKPADPRAARAESPALGERQLSSKAISPYAVRPAARANHWHRSGQEMVASGEHFGSGAKHIGKGSAQAARWAGRKASSGVRRIGSALKRIF